MSAANFGGLTGQCVSKGNWERHQFRRFGTRHTEHHSLVTGTTGINALGDVTRLFVDGDHNAACSAIDTNGGVVVADVFDGFADKLSNIYISFVS